MVDFSFQLFHFLTFVYLFELLQVSSLYYASLYKTIIEGHLAKFEPKIKYDFDKAMSFNDGSIKSNKEL